MSFSPENPQKSPAREPARNEQGSWQSFRFLDGSKSYQEIWDFQKAQLTEIADGRAPEALIFCEHERLLTKGKRSSVENLLEKSLPVYEIERGGDFTWHGPGQLVIYPLFYLQGEFFPKGLHAFLRFWEEVLIQVLKDFQLEAGRFGPTGVWIKNSRSEIKKIASMGIAVRKWITYHGIALNVSNSLEDFKMIRPCGFESEVMTSLENEGVSKSLLELSHLIEEKARSLLQLESRG